jgi:hypothetical protein
MASTSVFAGLRWDELMGFQRGDITLDAATIAVDRQVLDVGGGLIEGPPKTEAGRRTVAVPMVLVPELRRQLERYTGPDDAAGVFVGEKGATPRSSKFGTVSC